MIPEVIHGAFTIERTYAAAPARVFGAFANADTKRRWFVDGNEGLGLQVDSFTEDFRIGGRASNRVRFMLEVEGGPPKGTMMGNDAVYLDIVANQRIVFANTMLVGDQRTAVSLTTFQFIADGKGTKLVCTEQSAFFDRVLAQSGSSAEATAMREHGWNLLLARVDEVLGQTP